jgi:hypothetical protein
LRELLESMLLDERAGLARVRNEQVDVELEGASLRRSGRSRAAGTGVFSAT